MTHLKGHAAFVPGCAMHSVGKESTFLPAAFPSTWHACSPGWREDSGVHGPSTSPVSGTPAPAFGSCLGWGSPGRVTSQLCLQPIGDLCFCVSLGPILAARQRAHCPSIPEARIARPVPAVGKGSSTERPSRIRGCLSHQGHRPQVSVGLYQLLHFSLTGLETP